MIGYAICASFCTIRQSLEQMRRLQEAGYDILPIVSENVYACDTRFQTAREVRERIESITGRSPLHTLVEVEPLGPRIHLDALIVAPITGNTLAKVAAGITDGAVTMAIKAHLRSDRPTLLAPASNDALSQNLPNIGRLLTRKSVYFVPMRQDDPERKPHSLVADFEKLPEALTRALRGEQMRPLFLS